MPDKTLKILVIQGPNLNLLGQRESLIYGSETLETVHAALEKRSGPLQTSLSFFQSNHEGAIIDRIQAAKKDGVDGILINAGALTHTSIGLRDVLAGTAIPFVEVHISNVHAREEFRHHSYLSAIAAGIVVGFGTAGYDLGLEGLVRHLRRPKS